MAKVSSVWECQTCGAQQPKWLGRCPECGAWGSLVETAVSAGKSKGKKAEGSRLAAKPQKLSEALKDVATRRRISTGIGELDRVLGNSPGTDNQTASGLVPGAVVLLAGEPGMGKSTLLSQVALSVASKPNILYVCGEESPSQVAMRLSRLGKAADNIVLLPETDVDAVIGHIQHLRPSLVIIDSIQTMQTTDLSGMAGAVGQVRESAGRLSQVAKSLNTPLFLVGHVTKEGSVAGPKVLEHLVDVVLVLEGDRSGALRMVRAVKNRFGPVDEVGLFAMQEGGMREVANPAELLIGDSAGQAQGSVLGCVLEGQRPLVLEVQALVVPSKLAVPRRVGHGVNERRLQLLCAVIEKHVNSSLGEKDVFVNIAGGLRSPDPGLDLAVAAAIISSAYQGKREEGRGKREIPKTKHEPSSFYPLASSLIFCGEVGLLGEVRQVAGWERREKEVKRLGLGTLVGKGSVNGIRELPRILSQF